MAEPSPIPERSSLPYTQAARAIFVGRLQEMSELTVALDDAMSGKGRLVMLGGEPGIGKTSTAQELASHAEKLGAHALGGKPGPVQRHRQTEVADLGGAILGEPDVARLQVPVDDAPAVGEL